MTQDENTLAPSNNSPPAQPERPTVQPNQIARPNTAPTANPRHWSEDHESRIRLYALAKKEGLIWIPGSPVPQRTVSIVTIGPGLLMIQNDIQKATKDTPNLHFKSKYADLAAMFDASTEALFNSGLKLQETMIQLAGGWYLHDELIHPESGEFVASIAPILFTQKDNPQAFGSGLTYARRYNMQTILRIVADDDDGNAAAGNNRNGNSNSGGRQDEPRRDFRGDPPRQPASSNGIGNAQSDKPPIVSHIEDNIPRPGGPPKGASAQTLEKLLAMTKPADMTPENVNEIGRNILNSAHLVFSAPDTSPEDALMAYAELLGVAHGHIAKMKEVAERTWGGLRSKLVYQRSKFCIANKVGGWEKMVEYVKQFDAAQKAREAAANQSRA